MKKLTKFLAVFLLMLLTTSQAWAGENADKADIGVIFSVNGSTEKYVLHNANWLTCTNCSDWTIKDWTDYSNHNFGNVSSFTLKGVAISGWVKTSSKDWLAAKIFYKIYKSGESEPGSNTGEFGVGNYGESGDNPWQYICGVCYESESSNKTVVGMDDQNVDLISSRDPGMYNMKIFTNAQLRYNGGSYETKTDYTAKTATFTIMPKVTFNANGGSGSMNAQYVKYNENDALNSNTFTAPTGYRFKEWKDGSGNTYSNGATIKITSNITLTAQWEAKTYTLNLDDNNGTGIVQQVSVTYNSDVISYTTPSKTGYGYKGYYTNNGVPSWGTQVVLISQAFVANASGWTSSSEWTKDADNQTLYAKWDANKYNVKFSLNGGSGDEMTKQQHTYDQSLALSKNTYTRIGYNFIGWNTDKNATTALYADEAVVSNLTTGTTQVELFAIWSPTTTTITIYKNDQGAAYQDEPTVQMTATYDAPMPSTEATSWTRTGYNLNNFYLERGCTKIITSINVKYAQSKTYDDVVYTNGSSDPLWNFTGTTLNWYAKWTAKTYTITFKPNGGSSAETSKQATYDSRTGIATCAIPTHATANFAGYYLDAEGTGDPLYNANGDLQSSVSGYTDASGNWIHDGNVDVYAKWTSTYIVTLNNMSATSAGTQQVEVEQGKTTGLTSPISCPEKTGYTFGGYFAAASGGGTKVIDATGSWVIPAEGYIDNEGKWIPANGAEFKAYWINNKTKVTFEKQSGTGGTSQVTLTYNSTDNMESITIPTRTGYTFGGYFTGVEGAGTQLITNEGAWIPNVSGYTGDLSSEKPKWMKTTTTDLTLYAKWTPITYTITYAGNGNTGGSTESSSHTYDVAKTLTTNGFTRAYTVTYNYNGATSGNETVSAVANYTFANWTYNETNYSDKQSVTNLASTQDAVVTMTAQWTPASVTLPSPAKTGYNFTGWYNNSALIGNAGASYIPTADIALTAQWTPKTYTVSFNNNGGTGTVPGNVQATYDQAMPALSPFTAPVKNGHKFLGYYYGDTKYYNADGTSARNWNVDGNTELTAKWDQIHVYIEGHFRVRNGKNGEWVTPGNNTSEYASESKKVEMPLSGNKYVLNTWADVHELRYSGRDLNFYIATWSEHGGWTKLGADISGENFWFNKVKPENMSSTLRVDGKNFWFKQDGDGDWSYPVILTYDPTANTLSYTAEPEQTYTVTFIAGGHGHLNEEGPRSVGVRSGYNITATADKGYHFVRFDKTGDVTINANGNTANITVTGEGTVTATFAHDTRVYFTKPSSWTGSDLYAYFDTYWSTTQTGGSTEEGAGSKGKAAGKAMEHIKDNIYAVSYSGSEAHSTIAFVNAHQDGYQAFDQTSVTYRNDFNRCSTKNWFDTRSNKTGDYNKYTDNKGNSHQTAYYNDGEWKAYQDMPVEFYMRNSLDWDKVCDAQRFKATSDPNIYEMIWPVSELNGKLFDFKVWQTCDCWYGKQNTTINTDGQSINLECNTADGYNISFTPWKVGSYEFKLDISTMNLKVNFLDDIVVEDFPQEISVLNSRQYKITPNVRFFNNTKPQDITIEVEHTGGTSDLATYTQSGTNLIVLGDATKTGQETVNVYYKKNSEIIQTRTLIVNVAQPITIQADMASVAATEKHWTNTNLVHVHFWGTNADKSQDAQMTYNETEKVYSVTVPKILGNNGQFNFIIWYGESLSMLGSDNAKWRQTANLATTGNTCYTMGTYTKDNENRTATPGTVGTLCLPDVYQVEVYMKNGRTYTSNSVTANDEDKTMSFFAPKDNDNTYSGGQVYLLNNGTIVSTITGFSQADVYTATLNIPATGDASLSNITAYNGDYYVIAGVSGNGLADSTKMHKFTPRANTAEDYSYYWTVYSGNCTDKNVIAKVANEYNSNLSLTIGADALTQSDGTVAAGNVRFSYEPTTNAFKRAILGASNSNDFLNVYGNNVFADAEATQPLSESQDLSLSKFTDNSDWVYEKVVYVKVDNEESESKVTLKSVFNGQTSHLLGYAIDETTGEEKKDSPNQLTVLGKGSTTGASAYAIRISYDFKKNRLISSWEPTATTYNSDMSINSDILFIRSENGDVQQVQVGVKDGTESYKISSLQHVMFVMEIDGSTDQTSYSQYWISLPFDCQISDIFGVEGYITLDENRIAQKGTWGIMRYRGDLRAQKGWFKETDGFWEWMYENETMNAGEGYVLFFERSSIPAKDWPTIKDKGGVEKALKRLYFPSKDAGFVMSNTVDAAHSQFTCESMRCNIKTPEDREAYDSNWRVIGPKSYNNITADNIETDADYGTQTKFPDFLYTYDTSKEKGQKYIAQDGEKFNYQSFHAYMVQYEGTITWMPYTQTTTPATVAARNVEDSNFKGGTLTIELMQNNEQLDRTFVKLDKNGTTGFDFSQDLTKITENCAQIASVNEDVLYAGSTLPLDIELVPLNVKVTADGTYDIALKQSLEGLEVKLFDAFEQTITPLDLMSATVTLEKGEYKDRFFLQLKQKGADAPTSFDGKMEQYNLPMDKTQKLLINGNIYLINAGRVYNATGAELR